MRHEYTNAEKIGFWTESGGVFFFRVCFKTCLRFIQLVLSHYAVLIFILAVLDIFRWIKKLDELFAWGG